jgi:hypothetical protein
MIADPRFPVFFLSISLSLSPQNFSTRTCSEVRLSRALCADRRPVASPFRGRERRDSLDRGISKARHVLKRG